MAIIPITVIGLPESLSPGKVFPLPALPFPINAAVVAKAHSPNRRIIEMNVGIICACMPACAAVFRHPFPDQYFRHLKSWYSRLTTTISRSSGSSKRSVASSSEEAAGEKKKTTQKKPQDRGGIDGARASGEDSSSSSLGGSIESGFSRGEFGV